MTFADHILVMLGIMGWVVLLHASPIPLPNRRPFNCALCTCSWAALAVYAWFVYVGRCDYPTAAAAVGMTALASMVSTGLAPWLWRSF